MVHPNLQYIDAHCHPNLGQFDDDRGEVIKQMADEQVGGFVVGVNSDTSRFAVELAEKYEHLWAIIGYHPGYVDDEMFDEGVYRKLLEHSNVIGIGECGFDYFRTEKTSEHIEIQTELFKKQIELALEFDKPLMLHLRPQKGTMDAYDDAIALLKEYKETHPLGERLRGQSHFFAGEKRHIEEFVKLGFYISFTGVITFAPEYRELILATPPDRILAETDAPYVSPTPYRGQRCLPTYVKEVYATIHDISGLTNEDILRNLNSLYKIW